MSYSSRKFKQRAHALVDRLPHDATWEDLADHAIAWQDLEERGVQAATGRIAEEVFDEYKRIQAEVERSLARKHKHTW